MKKELEKWICTVLLIPIIIFLIINKGKFIFIDYINLLIHEGGHGIFKIFGKFLHAIGGTLTQILIPVMFVIYYLKNEKIFISQILLVWLGENFLNISVYAADARTQKLPLLGGKKVYHDWNYILNELGILNYDFIVGEIFYFIGIIIFIIALLLPLNRRGYKKEDIDLKL
ncbi:MAG: hypothetical protein QHH13_02795 [Melioribacter sp.]|uniref:hypothetical protein n=1 Tax=Rosettibacter primus TaxID=3111523 RepID=UPI00247C498D|nr:hypothetical protein [Melioribacter sp.]